jgi:hypothetical protein
MFFSALTTPELFDVIEALLPEHRERKYPPTEALSMFLTQAMNADKSCQNVVNEIALSKALCRMSPISSNTGSYCKARKRLPLTMITELVRHTGHQTAKSSEKLWDWKGRPVRLVDGTTVELPDTPENQRIYAQNERQHGCPLARIVGIICLASGSVMNAAMGPVSGKGSGEQGLLRNILDTLKPNDILLGDAYYGSYFLLAELSYRKIDAVFEQYGARKRVTDFRKGKTLGKRDHLIVYPKPPKPDWMSPEKYDAIQESITVRELMVGGRILVTTMLSEKLA